MSRSKLSTSALAVLLVGPTACADDTPPATAAEESSSSGGVGSEDGPPLETTATATDTSPGSTGGPTATDGTDAPGTSTASDAGTTSPDLESSGGSSSGESSTDGGSTDSGSTDSGSTDSGSTDSGSTDSGTSGGSSTDGSSTDGSSTDSGTSGGSSTDGSSTDGSSTDGSSTDGSSSGGVSELDMFESPQLFGDQVAETDLIGAWSLPTDGSMPGYTMTFVVGADGTFSWREYNEFCEPERQGSGWLWVSGSVLVMLWDDFNDTAPWDVMGKFGWDSEAPFLTRSGYVPALGHLAITFPDAMRVATPWGSRGYVRTVGGVTIEDVWIAETELWDVPPGHSEASVVGRKRYTMDVGMGDAWETINHWWFEDGIQTADPTEYYLYTYTDELNGYGTIAGEDYLYLGSGMMTYEPGENFLLDGPAPCNG